MDLIRLQCLPLAEALERVRNDQEHRMFHWVQLFRQPGHQRAIFCTTFLVKFVQLSEAIRGGSFSQPVFRGQSAHEQTRQACIHGEVSRGQVLIRRQSPRLAKAKEKAVHQKAKAEDPVSKTW